MKIALATLALSSILLLTLPLFDSWLNGNILQQVSALSCLISLAVALYAGVLFTLKLSEMNIIADKLKNRFFKR